MTRLVALMSSVLLLGIAASCSAQSPQVENAPPTASVSPAELAELQASWVTLRAEVVEALEGYLEGYYNGNEARIRNYLSESCSPDDVEEIVTGSSLFRLVSLDLFDREVEYDVQVKDDLLTIEMDEDGLVAVAFEPAEAVLILADGSPVPKEVLEPAGKIGFGFRREGSFLQIVTCGAIAERVREWIQTEVSP